MGTNIHLIYLYVHQYISKARPTPPPPSPPHWPTLANTPAHPHTNTIYYRAGAGAGRCWRGCSCVRVCVQARASACGRMLVRACGCRCACGCVRVCVRATLSLFLTRKPATLYSTCIRVYVCVCACVYKRACMRFLPTFVAS